MLCATHPTHLHDYQLTKLLYMHYPPDEFDLEPSKGLKHLKHLKHPQNDISPEFPISAHS